jgi:hypothetical protein
MATKIAVAPGSATAKIVTLGTAFVTGLAMAQLVKTRPTWGMPTTLVLGAGGVVGAMYLDGAWAEVSQGIAAASMATLGASLPSLMGAGTTSRRTALPVAAPRNAGVPVGYDWRNEQPVRPAV